MTPLPRPGCASEKGLARTRTGSLAPADCWQRTFGAAPPSSAQTPRFTRRGDYAETRGAQGLRRAPVARGLAPRRLTAVRTVGAWGPADEAWAWRGAGVVDEPGGVVD